jgi:hypothetical protein
VLGDCASAGTNVMASEITGKSDILVEYSMPWNDKLHQAIDFWYLKKNHKRLGLIDYNQVHYKALDYLYDQEIKNSYWKHFKTKVTNLSKNGATAYGYYKRLLKYEERTGVRPHTIFVTDYTMTHNWQRVNYNGNKYFFEKNFDERKSLFKVNPRLTSPAEVQKIAFEKAKSNYYAKNLIKRNQAVMSWFIKWLESKNYNFIKLKFYGGFDQFDDEDTVDCSDLVSQYTIGHGDRCDIKNKVGLEIALRIQNQHEWLGLANEVETSNI